MAKALKLQGREKASAALNLVPIPVSVRRFFRMEKSETNPTIDAKTPLFLVWLHLYNLNSGTTPWLTEICDGEDVPACSGWSYSEHEITKFHETHLLQRDLLIAPDVGSSR